MNEVFKNNPKLEKYYGTSDGEAFYNENDAKNHAKNLEDKTVETVFNQDFLEAIDSKELSEEEKAIIEFEASEKVATLDIVPETVETVEATEKVVETVEAPKVPKAPVKKLVTKAVKTDKPTK